MVSHSVYHWLIQRVTAFVLIPLSLWFLFKVLGVISIILKSFPELHLSISNISNTDLIILLCFFISAFYHAVLGVQVILEDYIHSVVLRASVFLVIKGIVILTVLFLTFIILYSVLLGY
ncbi:putative succinate dehydrogenase, hydrophobic membrane anchor protein [Ehrlichia chaffeensis str. Arkansas]|uniref:Succinate dehydrogenase hydrophobic membrane anchor subunit n=1 Tax=Ehrlichia chaffeensis (strain ATCC CRL-10679 / Arkansas) TaxID=205920 RepID=Q2GFS5_EHRCR|nr:succinate dehydrogenase, hydrophobic membrane anchor protein [Ehrlichia chaffeensis]ABD45382.1 putative succinate dehydrogenase, hydrophobic membrane anchor protein [Ehrlichia chaffeensis str. Arkansas]